jgi:Arabinose efflux permease
MEMQAIIVGWQVYSLTHDALSLGFIGLAEAIPSIITAIFAGHIVDKSERKKILSITFTLMMLCSFLLYVISLDLNQKIETYKLISIYSVIFISGIARGFYMPAAFALLGQMIPKESYSNAISLNTSTFQIGAISGPAIGGLLYGFFGISFSYAFITVLTLTGIILLNFVARKPRPVQTENIPLSESLSAGIKFVFKDKVILSAITLDLFAVLFGGAVALLPVYANDILNVGPKGLGILRASPAAGALLMGLFIARNPVRKNAGKILLATVSGFGICILVFAVSKVFLLSIAALALSGMFDNVSVIIRQTIIQLRTPDNMKGRVSAVNSIFIGSSNEIGSFESGTAAKIMGTVPSVLFGGIMTLLVVFTLGILSKKLKNLHL